MTDYETFAVKEFAGAFDVYCKTCSRTVLVTQLVSVSTLLEVIDSHECDRALVRSGLADY